MLTKTNLKSDIFNFRIRILGLNFDIVTDSYLFEKFIKDGFACSPITRESNNLLSGGPQYIFNHAEDMRKIYSSHLRLIRKIIADINKKYWIFHGSAFELNGEATILMGDGSSGKSMFLFTAGLLGAKIIGDEYALVDKKSHNVSPFRYFLKLKNYPYGLVRKSTNQGIRFEQYNFSGDDRFILLNKGHLNQIGIGVAKEEKPLKCILFLENKNFDSTLHLCKHCFNIGAEPKEAIGNLNKFISKKKVGFVSFKRSYFNDYDKVLLCVKNRIFNRGG